MPCLGYSLVGFPWQASGTLGTTRSRFSAAAGPLLRSFSLLGSGVDPWDLPLLGAVMLGLRWASGLGLLGEVAEFALQCLLLGVLAVWFLFAFLALFPCLGSRAELAPGYPSNYLYVPTKRALY